MASIRGGRRRIRPGEEFDAPEEALHACVRDNDLPRLRQILAASPTPELLNYPFPALGPPLHYAARLGRATAVDLLLAAGADPHLISTGEDPQLPALGFAAWWGHRALVRRLWTAGGPPERHITGLRPYQTPLVVAARYGHAAIVEDLLDWWRPEDDDGGGEGRGEERGSWSQELLNEALIWAARRWHYPVAALLLSRRSVSFAQETVQEALCCAVDNKAMLTYEWDVKYEGPDYADQQLLIAALIDSVPGADPNAGPPGNGTRCPHTLPLHLTAANANLTGALKTLLEKGADPNLADTEGRTALHLVSRPVPIRPMAGAVPARQNETAMRLLLKHGTSATQPDKTGERPLHLAAYGLDLRLFRLYLESRVSVDGEGDRLRLTNCYGETMLHYAAAAGSIETMEYLLAQGLDVNATSVNGWTPLLCALTPTTMDRGQGTVVKTQAQAVEAAQYLLARSADPLVVSSEGWTPLHVLALHRDPHPSNTDDTNSAEAAEALAKHLLTRGVDPEARAPLLSPRRRAVLPSTGMPWGHRLSSAMQSPETLGMDLRKTSLPPLHWAAERGAAGVVRALLAHGISVSAIDGDEDTMPARMAAESRFLLERKDLVDAIVDSLVGAGAGF